MRRLLALGLIAAACPLWAGPLDLPELKTPEQLNAFYDGGLKVKGAALTVAPLTPKPAAPTPTPEPRKPFLSDEQRKILNDMLNVKKDQAQLPRGYFLGDTYGPAAMNAMRPAFGFVQGVTDSIYELLRLQFLVHILPDRVYRQVPGAPKEDSFGVFDQKFHESLTRYAQWLYDNHPARGREPGHYDLAAMDAFKRSAVERLRDIGVYTAAETALARYQLNRTGQNMGQEAQNRNNWRDPHFLLVGAVGLGIVGWFFGVHTRADLGPLRLGIDLNPGNRINGALNDKAGVSRDLAGVEVGYPLNKDSEVALHTQWGVDHAQIKNDVYGVRYRVRF